jgi:hypothetical protein
MSESFLSNFIADCVRNGKTSPNEMCLVAEERIQKVDQEMKRIEGLRTEKTNLYSAIKQLGGNKAKERIEYKNADFSIPFPKLAERYRELIVSICDLLEKEPEGMFNADILTSLSVMGIASLEDNELVFFAIKWLGGRMIIDKTDQMLVVKGSSWNKRPYDK